MSDGASYGCILEFDTDEREFVRGWECSMVYHALRDSDGEREFMVHDNIVEMLMRIAEGLDMRFEADLPCDGWVNVRFL